MTLLPLIDAISAQLPDDSPLLPAIAALKTAATPYADIDPEQAKSAILAAKNRQAIDEQLQTLGTERDTLRTQADTLQANLVNSQRELAAVRGLVKAGVRPEYEDLLLPKAANSLELADGQVTAPEGLWDSLKQTYPAMFFADDAGGTGGTGGDSGITEDSTPVVVAVDSRGIFSAPTDDILGGKVTVSL